MGWILVLRPKVNLWKSQRHINFLIPVANERSGTITVDGINYYHS